MTTPAEPMLCDIPALHAAIAEPSVLQRERRVLYRLAAELLDPGCPQVLGPDVIDCPLTRHRIGDALAGHASLACSALVGISAIAGANSGIHELAVASHAEANTLLAAALNTVGAQLPDQQGTSQPPGLLTEADSHRFTSALAVLSEGLALARSVSLELIDDLLNHIALVGIIAPERAGGLVSASSRTVPGLVLLTATSSINVAEALVHEGAHQKLFDLAITRDLFNAGSDRCPPFYPPWGPRPRRWPLEQTLAACHAYACLAQFSHDAGARMLGTDSLLPVARDRSKILGDWLLDHHYYLGADAHTLLDGLFGQPRPSARTISNGSSPVAGDYVVDPALQFRRCVSPGRVLVGRPGQPPQLYWISDDAAVALELLAQTPVDEVTHVLAQRWHLSHSAAAHRLTSLFADLADSGILTSGNTESIDH